MRTLSLGDDTPRSATLADALPTDGGHLELVGGAGEKTGDCGLPGPRVSHVEHLLGRGRAGGRHRPAVVGLRRRVDDLVATNDATTVCLGRRSPLYQDRRRVDCFYLETTWLTRN